MKFTSSAGGDAQTDTHAASPIDDFAAHRPDSDGYAAVVALAGLGSDLTPQAIAADGSVIATCPPAGVLVEDVIFECTLAPDAVVPVTTTLIADPTDD
jgi:hypothetical protein